MEKKTGSGTPSEATTANNAIDPNTARRNTDENAMAEGVARLPSAETDKFRAERSRRAASQQSEISGPERRGKMRGGDVLPTVDGIQPGAFAVAGMSSTSQDNAIEMSAFSNNEERGQSNEVSSHQEQLAETGTHFSSFPQPSSWQENGVSTPMVEAQLVDPPVEAMKVVVDEDHGGDVEAHREQASESALGADSEQQLLSNPRNRTITIGLALLVVVLAVVIPTSIVFKRDQEDEKVSASTQTGESERSRPAYPYECYWNNNDLIGAQINNPDQKRFIMCPGTHTKIGRMEDPANGKTNITNGDVMMMILRDNIEVLCGENGSVENNCVLDGGFLQVLLQRVDDDDIIPVGTGARVDTVLIRGMTFTGDIFIDPFVGGASIVASHPGENIRFVDCRWENMTALQGVVHAGVNPYQLSSVNLGYELPKSNEIDVRFVNCTFRNISYGGGCFISAYEQRVAVERCSFSDIRLAPFTSRCEGAVAAIAEEVDSWCHSLISCEGNASCAIRDICVDDFEYAAKSAILSASHGAVIVLEGSNSFHALKASFVDENDTCPNGLAWRRDDQQASSCMIINDSDTSWEFGPDCHL
jgi:hypothetical protein